ncbi:RagB/SusD family nutrient uptake outer membrane protein [Parabacteroides sp. OttesenSCG-928-B22]|nr:RagB/SusD family nutrient uptake outer membrane protein [Parabacteroides sp. OttesenSCG-928-B22]
MKTKSIYKWGISLLSLCLFTGCFNLDEEVFSEITEASFVPTEQDIASILSKAYQPMINFYDWYGEFDAQEEPADVILTPERPVGWVDGGIYLRNHQHKWTPRDGHVTGPYGRSIGGVNATNRIVAQIEAGELPFASEEQQNVILAELRAIRAFWYSRLLDTHGNVPIVTDFTDTEVPQQSTRKQVFDFVTSELEAAIASGLLSEEVGSSTYGRMNVWAAYMTLARVYLNAGVYTGTPEWQKALDAAQKVIDSGKYQLSADYSDNFKASLDYTNKEVIWAIPHDALYAPFTMYRKWFASGWGRAFGSSWGGWSGSCANPQFINSYTGLRPGEENKLISDDKRFEKTWVNGNQYQDFPSVTGTVLFCPVNHLPAMTGPTVPAPTPDNPNATKKDVSENYGLRVGKFEARNQPSTSAWSNDVPFIRYAETLMIKAECLLRMGKNEEEAAALVSQIRARAFDDPAQATVTADYLKGNTVMKYGTLDLEGNIDVPGDQTPVVLGGLYDELGWEFACEMQRRQQMIRFGTFTTKNWFNHVAEPGNEYRTLFPFTYSVLNANKNMKQNPGYPSE